MARKEDLKRNFEIQLFLDDIRTPENIGGICRLANCFSVSRIWAKANRELLESKSFRSISRINKQKLPISIIEEDKIEAIQSLKEEGWKIVSLEYTTKSRPINDFVMNEKCVLVLGNERHGIDSRILELSDETIHIPIHGEISSLNVQQACAIALYQLSQ